MGLEAEEAEVCDLMHLRLSEYQEPAWEARLSAAAILINQYACPLKDAISNERNKVSATTTSPKYQLVLSFITALLACQAVSIYVSVHALGLVRQVT